MSLCEKDLADSLEATPKPSLQEQKRAPPEQRGHHPLRGMARATETRSRSINCMLQMRAAKKLVRSIRCFGVARLHRSFPAVSPTPRMERQLINKSCSQMSLFNVFQNVEAVQLKNTSETFRKAMGAASNASKNIQELECTTQESQRLLSKTLVYTLVNDTRQQ